MAPIAYQQAAAMAREIGAVRCVLGLISSLLVVVLG
jgi:hypothetical protein